MNTSRLIGFLRSVNDMPLHKAEEIATHFSEMEIPRHAFLLHEGRICDTWLFLENGFMRGFAHNGDGEEVTTGFHSPGVPVFEVSSFFHRVRSKENIQALTDCNGWYLSFEQLNGLFHSMPEFREFGRAILVRGYTGLKSRMLEAITETAEARYANFLQSNPEIFQHASLKSIASFLGITDTSLSRIRKEFAKK